MKILEQIVFIRQNLIDIKNQAIRKNKGSKNRPFLLSDLEVIEKLSEKACYDIEKVHKSLELNRNAEKRRLESCKTNFERNLIRVANELIVLMDQHPNPKYEDPAYQLINSKRGALGTMIKIESKLYSMGKSKG